MEKFESVPLWLTKECPDSLMQGELERVWVWFEEPHLIWVVSKSHGKQYYFGLERERNVVLDKYVSLLDAGQNLPEGIWKEALIQQPSLRIVNSIPGHVFRFDSEFSRKVWDIVCKSEPGGELNWERSGPKRQSDDPTHYSRWTHALEAGFRLGKSKNSIPIWLVKTLAQHEQKDSLDGVKVFFTEPFFYRIDKSEGSWGMSWSEIQKMRDGRWDAGGSKSHRILAKMFFQNTPEILEKIRSVVELSFTKDCDGRYKNHWTKWKYPLDLDVKII